MSLEITVRLEAPELAASISALAAAMISKPTIMPTAPVKTKKEKEPAVAVPVADTAPNPATQPAPETTPDPTPAAEPEITFVQVKEKLVALSQAGKQAQVKTLITKLGAAKLSDVPAEKYAELMKEAGAL